VGLKNKILDKIDWNGTRYDAEVAKKFEGAKDTVTTKFLVVYSFRFTDFGISGYYDTRSEATKAIRNHSLYKRGCPMMIIEVPWYVLVPLTKEKP